MKSLRQHISPHSHPREMSVIVGAVFPPPVSLTLTQDAESGFRCFRSKAVVGCADGNNWGEQRNSRKKGRQKSEVRDALQGGERWNRVWINPRRAEREGPGETLHPTLSTRPPVSSPGRKPPPDLQLCPKEDALRLEHDRAFQA